MWVPGHTSRHSQPLNAGRRSFHNARCQEPGEVHERLPWKEVFHALAYQLVQASLRSMFPTI